MMNPHEFMWKAVQEHEEYLRQKEGEEQERVKLNAILAPVTLLEKGVPLAEPVYLVAARKSGNQKVVFQEFPTLDGVNNAILKNPELFIAVARVDFNAEGELRFVPLVIQEKRVLQKVVEDVGAA